MDSPETLADIAIFAAVVREGSFTRAADKLELSTSQVSKCVNRLERNLKNVLVPGALFQALGFHYFCPIDGHDLSGLRWWLVGRVIAAGRQSARILLLTDFYDLEGYTEGVRSLLAQKFLVHLVHVVAREEMAPAARGRFSLLDLLFPDYFCQRFKTFLFGDRSSGFFLLFVGQVEIFKGFELIRIPDFFFQFRSEFSLLFDCF